MSSRQGGTSRWNPPLLALGDLGGRPAGGASPVVVEAFEDVGARPADRLGIEGELCPGGRDGGGSKATVRVAASRS